MFNLCEHTPEIKNLSTQVKELVSQILKSITAERSEVILDSNFAFEKSVDNRKLYLIREGFVTYEYQGKKLFFYDVGDIIGWQSSYLKDCKIFTDSKILVDEYPLKQFHQKLQDDSDLNTKWYKLMELYQNLMIAIMSQAPTDAASFTPETRHFAAGNPIIIQGTSPTEVFTMLRGVANVFVNDLKVGEIKDGEMFGAMAATTMSARSASVIAAESCFVLVVSKENFLSLAKTHPHTMLKLIEDMSRIIVNQNEKFVALAN